MNFIQARRAERQDKQRGEFNIGRVARGQLVGSRRGYMSCLMHEIWQHLFFSFFKGVIRDPVHVIAAVS